MSSIYWILCVACIVGVWYSSEIHLYLSSNLSIYTLENAQLIQVILAVLAGILSTKASDSSNELRKLLKVKDIQDLLEKADDAQNKSKKEKERLNRLVDLVEYEVEQQYAREMLTNHRSQLMFHWAQIAKLESVLDKGEDPNIDPKVRQVIQNYILRNQYIEYMGRRFIRNIPFLGPLIDNIFGPLIDVYYFKNINKINKIIGRKKPSGDTDRDGKGDTETQPANTEMKTP